MSPAPHEQPAFVHAVEYTVNVTFVVAGGARPRTAERRAEVVAKRLANTAARAAGVVEVSAVGGHSRDGQVVSPKRMRFDAANTYGQPDRLDRYLDPDRELALASFDAANEAFRKRRDADERRRRAIDCRNPLPGRGERSCPCVYCLPRERLLDLELAETHPIGGRPSRVCLCGEAAALAGARCARHQGVVLSLLAGDPFELEELLSAERGGSVS